MFKALKFSFSAIYRKLLFSLLRMVYVLHIYVSFFSRFSFQPHIVEEIFLYL